MSAIDNYNSEKSDHEKFMEFIELATKPITEDGDSRLPKVERYGNDGIQIRCVSPSGCIYNTRLVSLLSDYIKEKMPDVVSRMQEISADRVQAAKQAALEEAVKFIQGSAA